jgi:hypothetical protein
MLATLIRGTRENRSVIRALAKQIADLTRQREEDRQQLAQARQEIAQLVEKSTAWPR